MKFLHFAPLLLRVTLASVCAAAQPPAETTKAPDALPAKPAPSAPAAPGQARAIADAPLPEGVATPNSPVLLAGGQKELRLKFRGARLATVLNYLSKEAGLIINLETPVNGTVDVWSEQPLTVEEAVNVLDSVLHKRGYAALRNGRLLTIVGRDSARKRDIPVKVGSKPEDIPKTDRMVTQILRVRYANALALTRNLQPLLPEYATLTANESGNALVLTDVQSDIHRMARIVQALDTSISGIATLRVFPLRFAEAKDLVNVIKELFPSSGNNNRGGGIANPTPMMPGAGPGEGLGGPGFAGGEPGGGGVMSGQSEARQTAARVTAIADERTNSLVVSAPADLIPALEQLVKQIDTNAASLTLVRVFGLRYADPVELADLLSTLFPDDPKADPGRSALQFGGPPGGFPGGPPAGPGNTESGASNRARLKSRVTPVADRRTSSLIVTAASDVMPQIEKMVAQLDAQPDKKQRVYMYSLQSASPNQMQTLLQDLFGSTVQSRNAASQNSDALETRQSQGAASVGQNLTQQNSPATGRNAFGGGSGQ